MFKQLLMTLTLLVVGLTAHAQLPNVVLHDLRGRAVATDTLHRGDRPLVIAFFATWCKPCLRELDAIAQVYDDWQQTTGVRLVAISIDEAQHAQAVPAFVEAQGWPFEVLLDPDSAFRRAMGVQQVPHTFVVDPRGHIVHAHTGYVDGGEDDLLQHLLALPSSSQQ